MVDFSEKLDFLMNITGTINSSLSHYTSLDASHISRLRRGERNMVREANYVRTMAIFFTRQCVEDYQKRALLDALDKPSDLLCDPEKTINYIYNWLLDDDSTNSTSIDGFLDSISKTQMTRPLSVEESLFPIDSTLNLSDISLHYGNEGKKQAVISFLSIVVESNKLDTLLLYSDEIMDWLTEDLSFLSKWAEMLKKVIMRGNRIKIIHTLSRDLDEMLEALTKWMPIYLTGAIEPYYYPKKRDGIFKRTLFIFPNIVALTATSIDPMTQNAVNILVKDSNAVEALMIEFNAYFDLCKPLMRIFTLKDQEQYLSTLEEFEKEESTSIVEAYKLSLATIPASVAKSMIERTQSPRKNELMNYYINRNKTFKKNMENNRYYEIIHLPDIAEIKRGNVELLFTGIEDFEGLCYSSEEYKAHLESIIELLQIYENYNLIIKRGEDVEGYTLYVKEDLGAFVYKTSRPNLVFAITESNMTAAFWDYLNSKLGKESGSHRGKKEVIKKLQAIIDRL